jgi:carbamoyl-phosphate synthase large subunit
MLQKGAESDGLELLIFGVDSRPLPPTVKGIHKSMRVPAPASPNYLSALNHVIKKNAIDLVIPQTTSESSFLSTQRETVGTKTAVLGEKPFRLLNDKSLLMSAFRDAGLTHPNFHLVDSPQGLADAASKLGYPKNDVVVKLPSSSGMRGVRRLSEDPETRDDFLLKKPNVWTTKMSTLISTLGADPWPELIVMEYLSGPEYSVDVVNRDGHSVVVPRKRDEIRSGISMATTLDLHREIIELVEKFLHHYKLEGLMGFQFILEANGPKILECNPRVQGTMVASLVSGVNILWLEAKWHLGLAIKDADFNIASDEGGFMRSWGGSLTYADGSIEHF